MHTSNGFSLVELMVVIAVVALLAAVATPSYISYVTVTKISRAIPLLDAKAKEVIEEYTLTGSFTSMCPVDTVTSLVDLTEDDAIDEISCFVQIDNQDVVILIADLNADFKTANSIEGAGEILLFVYPDESSGIIEVHCGSKVGDLQEELTPGGCNNGMFQGNGVFNAPFTHLN